MNKERLQQGDISWDEVREQFKLTRDFIHVGASQFLASHPRYVREAIEKYRDMLDENPTVITIHNEKDYAQDVRKAAARYMGVDNPNDIALTDSATMGLGTLYTGLNLQEGQEILATEHNHYSQQESIERATARTGAKFREIPLYKDLKHVTEDEIIEMICKEITENTRMVGTTWVHSDTGLKIPVSKIAKAIKEVNQKRDEEHQILFLVDGVHAFGIETETYPEIGCDYFITSCHKWLYGPRGTGLIISKPSAWQHVHPVIPSYRYMNDISINQQHPHEVDGKEMTPGGFHSMEHRWALLEAFEYIEKIGKQRIYDRVHQLNRQAKEGLASMPHVTLHTPIDDDLSAGIIAFEIDGMKSQDIVKKLGEKKVVATTAPYRTEYTRITPGIINTPEEIDKVLDAIQSLK